MPAAVAEYRKDVIGIPPQPCPACAVMTESGHCDFCGYDCVAEAIEKPPLAKPVVVPPSPRRPDVPADYHVCVLDSGLCAACGAEKEPIDGELQCPNCGEQTEKQLPPPPKIAMALPPAKPEVIIPSCRNEGCERRDLGVILIGGRFECQGCGEDLGVPLVTGQTPPVVPAAPRNLPPGYVVNYIGGAPKPAAVVASPERSLSSAQAIASPPPVPSLDAEPKKGKPKKGK